MTDTVAVTEPSPLDLLQMAAEADLESMGLVLLSGDDWRLVLALARRGEAADGWQPIETAPKDGTALLVGHEQAVFDAWWNGSAWVDGTTNFFDDEIEFSPTHWRPLPAPPGPKEDAECCFICGGPFKAGELVLDDINEGLGHRACFGDDRDGFVDLETGEPISADEPLPAGEPYEAAIDRLEREG